MKADKQQSGSALIDELINGGYDKDIITTLYGPSGSGKSNIALLATAQVLKHKHVLFIDTEGSFSAERMMQLLPEFQTYATNLTLLRPTSFDEQKHAFTKLDVIINQFDIGIIVVDSIAMLYRLEMGMTADIHNVNRELGLQLGKLTEIARRHNIPVLITNQVYADFDNKDNVNMVGGDLLKYSSKCLIELRKVETEPVHRTATIIKHRSIAEGKNVSFLINDMGLLPLHHESEKPRVL